MGKWLPLISLCATLLIQGCNTPVRDFDLAKIDRDGYDTRDSVHLIIDIADTLTPHSVYFSSRTDKDFYSPYIMAALYTTSPSGVRERHYIEIPTDKLIKDGVVKHSSQNGVCDIIWRWRDDFSPGECGEWKMTLLLLNRGEQESYIIKGIQEIGINIEPNERKR